MYLIDRLNQTSQNKTLIDKSVLSCNLITVEIYVVKYTDF